MFPPFCTDKPTIIPPLPPNPDSHEETKEKEVNDGEKSNGISHKFKSLIAGKNGESKRDEIGR